MISAAQVHVAVMCFWFLIKHGCKLCRNASSIKVLFDCWRCRNAPVCDVVCRLRAVKAGERRRLSGEASVRLGEAELQKLLVLGPAGDPEGLQGNAIHQRSQVDPGAHESSHGSRRILIRTAPVLRLVSSLFLFLQPDDQHHAEWHHQHAAVAQHGEVLEGSARYLCDAQTGRGAPEERPVQETTNHRLV